MSFAFACAYPHYVQKARIEKCIRLIMKGVGINDCVCGQTKRPPQCDGSHKYL